MIKKFKVFEGRRTKENQEKYERHIGHLIKFFNSPDMVRWEQDPYLRLQRWIKESKNGNANITIDTDEAKTLKNKLGIGKRKITIEDPYSEEGW